MTIPPFAELLSCAKKSDAAEVIKAVFRLWSNTTSHSVKRLHTDNGGEYMTSELQSFLRE